MKSVGVSMCSVCLCGTEIENIETLVMNFTMFTGINSKRTNIGDNLVLHYFSCNLYLLSPPLNQYSRILIFHKVSYLQS